MLSCARSVLCGSSHAPARAVDVDTTCDPRAVRRCRIAGDKNARAGGWPARITSADRNARRLGDGPPRRPRQSRLDRYDELVHPGTPVTREVPLRSRGDTGSNPCTVPWTYYSIRVSFVVTKNYPQDAAPERKACTSPAARAPPAPAWCRGSCAPAGGRPCTKTIRAPRARSLSTAARTRRSNTKSQRTYPATYRVTRTIRLAK